MEEIIHEIFNDGRMSRCLEVGRSIINCRVTMSAGKVKIRCSPIEGKSLDELRTMYFSFVVNNVQTDLPLIDTLVVAMIVKDHQQRQQAGEFDVKTGFTETEVWELLSLLRELR